MSNYTERRNQGETEKKEVIRDVYWRKRNRKTTCRQGGEKSTARPMKKGRMICHKGKREVQNRKKGRFA